MKKEIRILGFDDGPFTFNDKFTDVIGVIMRGGNYIECVLRQQISIDGKDVTEKIVNMVNKTKHKTQLKAAFIDGVALGGFNIVDIEKIYLQTNLPIITITREYPDFEKIKDALKKKFDDWKERFTLISNLELYRIDTKYKPIYVKFLGLSFNETKEIIKLSTIRGVIPEPIRVAHLIASGIIRGESNGKA